MFLLDSLGIFHGFSSFFIIFHQISRDFQRFPALSQRFPRPFLLASAGTHGGAPRRGGADPVGAGAPGHAADLVGARPRRRRRGGAEETVPEAAGILGPGMGWMGKRLGKTRDVFMG